MYAALTALRRLLMMGAVLVLTVCIYILLNSSRPDATIQLIGTICVVLIVVLVLWDAFSKAPEITRSGSQPTSSPPPSPPKPNTHPAIPDPNPDPRTSKAKQRFKKADTRLDHIENTHNSIMESAQRRASRFNIEDQEG